MKKNNLKISIMLILSLLVLFNISANTNITNSSASTSSSITPYLPVLEDLVDASPMIIDYDSDFESYGFPGDGSAGNPYRIENYNITTTGDYCLNFGGYTTKHFIVQNCFLKTDTNYGIYLGKYQDMAEDTVNIESNIIISTGSDALKIDGSVGGKIQANFLVGFTAGLTVKADFIYVKNNKITAELGIHIIDSQGAIILKNACNETTGTGIRVENSNGTIIIHNNCSNNANAGIVTENSHDLIISNNYLINNFFGMLVTGSGGSLITNNSFDTSTSYGLSMTLSTGLNKIYHNEFKDNNLAGTTIQALDNSGDQWYDEVLEEGNWWSDWSGSVSSTYTVDGSAGSEDLYPLGFVPEISEYTSGYISYIMIIVILAIPLGTYIRKRK
ncbi:MAG: right-handed parallel beta-helix repeat-containing protein [Candidatus Heimdallarchaeota archaeon]|nr:right-handed parallel beta-helix repeat-containing protein [Candidatus Heimdallarchaeota archaeon]